MSLYGALYRHLLWPFWERALHGRRTPYYYDELVCTQWLPAADIARRQDEKRQTIVEYAVKESPFYRARFAAAGVDPARCLEPDQWRRIPLLTKSDVQHHREEIRADSFRDQPVVTAHSGGSTGAPVEFYYNREHYDRRIAAWIRADTWGGYELGEKYWLMMIAVGSGVGKRPWKEVMKERLHNASKRWRVHSNTRMGPERIRWFVKDINRFRPRAIFGYGSAVHSMAQFMLKDGLRVEPCHGVIIGGEKTHAWQKDIIAKAFGTQVFERYGCQEFCNIAAECDRHTGMHVNADGLYVEVTDDDGNPLAPGQPGQIVVTSFDNTAMPFIRYKMGDLGTLAEGQCACGRGLPRIQEVLGREMDTIVTPEGNMCAGILVPHLMANFHHIQGFQFVQERLDLVRLRIVPDTGFDRDGVGYMEEQFRKYMGPAMKIEFEFVDTLETLRSGKYKMVVSKLEK
jgi:phenylacetate-CoA ligase